MTLPLLFFGHGSPMNALQSTTLTQSWARQIPAQPPAAILMISAHWFTQGTAVTAQTHPATVHDFFGFPDLLQQFQYPAPGHPGLADRIAALLAPHPVRLSTDWGLDHGSWSVLTHLYPDATVPVVQLSLDAGLSASQHLALASQLRPLRDQGVLIMASGNLVHNLRLLRWHSEKVPGWALDFIRPVRHWIEQRQFDQVANYQQLGDVAQLAVPHPDHFLPLLYVLGASTEQDRLCWFNDQFEHEALSMLSLRFDAVSA
ncbi:4,5-DOPA dioxygenase extradiol [Rheinheimera sp.]|uniref:4,5-DOPA-extradiol-dioxygenase n=1 Tax=Rheinheimera sp. TaxID=1869214 RepID=UPI00307DA343